MTIERKRVSAVFHWRPWGPDYEMVLACQDDDTGKRYFAKSIEWSEYSVGSTPNREEILIVSEADARRLVDSFSGTPALDRGQMPEVVKAKDEHINDLKLALTRADSQAKYASPGIDTRHIGSADE